MWQKLHLAGIMLLATWLAHWPNPALSNTKDLSNTKAEQTGPKVLIKALQTTDTEFFAHTETEPISTYAEYRLKQIKKTPRPIHLAKLLKQAQMDFLSYEPESSKKTFRTIAEGGHSFDWGLEERKIIFYSLLRLAQMEQSPGKQALLLKEALSFSQNLKPDTRIFPPPLLDRYREIKNSTQWVSLDLSKIFPAHDIILINGFRYSKKDKPLLPEGLYRIHALSSSHKSWAKTLSLARLISTKVKTKGLASGTCRQATLNPSVLKPFMVKNKPALQVLFPNFCVWDSTQALAQQIAKTDPLAKDLKMQGFEPGIKPVSLDLQKKPHKTHWEEWLWLGVAVALGATTVYSLIDSHSLKKESLSGTPKPAPPAPAPSKPIIKIGF